MGNDVRTRIAPSPTGPVHIGNLRTAVFNYLFARKRRGSFVLRFEDTDKERSAPEWEETIIREFRWAGLEWDEGPDVGGPCGPYRQSERLDLYRGQAERLLENRTAYECFCTPEELELERRRASERGEVYHYSGRCRDLTREERESRRAEGRRPAVRFRVDPERLVTFEDVLHGTVRFPGKDIGDFVILRPDGRPVYHLAVVVDDALMEISHVIRADEHLTNTPLHVLLFEALGFEQPVYAHVGLVLDEDRKKLSKRRGGAFVGDFRQKGYLPEALLNALVLLGWSPDGEEEIFSRLELIERFSLERLSTSGAVFDIEKLNWMNAQYIKTSEPERLRPRVVDFLKREGMLDTDPDPDEAERIDGIIALLNDDLKNLAEFPEKAAYFFRAPGADVDPEVREVLEAPEAATVFRSFLEKLDDVDALDAESVRDVFDQLRSELDLGAREIFMPVRAVLTGHLHGPAIYDTIALLGRDRVVKRMENRL